MTTTPPPVPGDAKDWTWVLDTACPECGFVAADVEPTGLGDAIRANAECWMEVLRRPDAATRSEPDRWSALEYAGHVRDVLVVYQGRLDRMLHEDGPHYANWDQDATALESRYDLADPATVADEIRTAAAALAARFDGVAGPAWDRPGYRSDGAAFTVDSFARYFIHDLIHHLWDVGAPSP